MLNPVRSFLISALILAPAACSSSPASDAVDSDAADLSSMTPGVDESSLDRSVDPCNDFYAFACGGFIASQPPETVSATRFAEVQRHQNELLDATIAGLHEAPRTGGERKAAAFYDSCMTKNDEA